MLTFRRLLIDRQVVCKDLEGNCYRGCKRPAGVELRLQEDTPMQNFLGSSSKREVTLTRILR